MSLSLLQRLANLKIKVFGAAGEATNPLLPREEQGKAPPASQESLQAVVDSIDAIVYVADMNTYELLLVNDFTRRLFGDIQGKKCWTTLQQGQAGPCDFCSNSRLLDTDGVPLDVYVWEFQNTVNGRWYECRDKAIRWADGRMVRLEIATDVTARRQAETALRESEEKFRLFLEYCPVYVFFKDENIRSLNLSRNFEKMLGRPLPELLGKSMDELFPSELARSMVEDDRRVMREGKHIEVEEEFNGRIYSTLKFPILIDGKPRFLAGFTTDITEHKLAENRVVESEERFRSAFDHAAIGMALVGMDGRFLKVNHSLCKIVGYTEKELLSLTFQKITHPADLDTDLALSAKLFAGEIQEYQMEKRYLHKNGGIIWILLSGSVVRDSGGAILYALAQIQDITERKRAEEELRQQIERYDLVVAGARDGIWDWDVPNKRVFFSPRWKSMRGYSEEEVGDSEEEWSSKIHPDDAPRVFASIQTHFEGKTPWFSEEYRVRRKDGVWMWVLDRGLAMRDPAGRVIRMAGSESDITARKKLEAEREKLIADLGEALAKVKTLTGLLPICSFCKKIRDDQGYWNQLEIYIRDRSEAEFSHGICPDCVKKYYPEHYDNINKPDNRE